MVDVHDPGDAAHDPALPELVLALDPAVATRELASRLTGVVGDARFDLDAITVVRHKPGRRCLVRYDASLHEPDGAVRSLPMLGKVRVHRYGKSGWRQLRAFRDAGFDDQAADRIAVPEPLGTVPAFHMWLQRVVPGEPITDHVAGPRGAALAVRAAEASAKIHHAGVTSEKSHSIDDELEILGDRLFLAAQTRPDLTMRIGRIAAAADRRADAVRGRPSTGIHRDFYADQVLAGVDGWLFVVDLDLYCLGDPALDVGNFVAHLTEQALRATGDPRSLRLAEEAFVDRFLELEGRGHADAVAIYTDLTLARHIWLSTVVDGRGHTTDALVTICEERFDLG
jgi:Phosphotransferase enzyme family